MNASTSGAHPLPLFGPTLADLHTEKNTSQATRDGVSGVFQAFHQYVGDAIGEHLGYIFTSTWTVLPCIVIIQTHLFNSIWDGLGILPGLGMLTGVFEEKGLKAAALINAISHIACSLWLIAFCISL